MRGLLIAIRSVVFTLILLAIMTYMFSIAMKSQTKGTDAEGVYFKTVLDGVAILLIHAICPDLQDPIFDIIDTGPISTFIYVTFLFLVSITMMNMLIGILCEVITCVSTVERAQLEISHMKEGLWELVKECDVDASGQISVNEFQNLLQNPEAVKFMQSVD